MKYKLGLYGKYEKITGSLIGTVVKKSNEIHISNEHSKTYVHELLTEDEDLIYNYPKNKIPKIALSFDADMSKSTNDNYYLCDLCGEYFTKKDMDFIPTKEQLDENPGICSQCINCT